MAIDDAVLSRLSRHAEQLPRVSDRHRSARFSKRLLDIVLAAGLLVLLAPVLVALSIAVLVSSGWPICFVQERVGRNGRPFRIVKFRSMVKDASERLHADPELYEKYLANGHKLPEGEDPRLTRIGGFLRSSSLDELPQLINVLLGSMSLVGPRPVLDSEIRLHYGDAAQLVLELRPGMTGLWQVSGRNELDYVARVRLDLDYVETWSVKRDIRILFGTIRPVLKRIGAS